MNTNSNLCSFNEYTLADRYPIHRACRDGDIRVLDQLLQIDNPDFGKSKSFACEDTFYGWMPIHWAAYHGQLACVRKLLTFTSPGLSTIDNGEQQQQQFGANETRVDENWNSLIDVRASNFRQTPLHLAAFGNHVECLKWLLDAGASPHLTDSLGETAAHKAARCGGAECLSLLAAHGVNMSVVNNVGQTAADLAAACGHTRCSTYLQRILQNGGSIDFVASADDNGSTMEIDQSNTNTTPSVFVNGMYGYQPCLVNSISGCRKRRSEGEMVFEAMDKRCKNAWKKDDAVQQEHRSQFVCTMTKSKPRMTGHCLM